MASQVRPQTDYGRTDNDFDQGRKPGLKGVAGAGPLQVAWESGARSKRGRYKFGAIRKAGAGPSAARGRGGSWGISERRSLVWTGRRGEGRLVQGAGRGGQGRARSPAWLRITIFCQILADIPVVSSSSSCTAPRTTASSRCWA